MGPFYFLTLQFTFSPQQELFRIFYVCIWAKKEIVLFLETLPTLLFWGLL